MVPLVAAALARLRSGLEARFGPRLREVVLFGSHARGTATEESDVDVLVVVDDLSERERRDAGKLADAVSRAYYAAFHYARELLLADRVASRRQEADAPT